MSSIGSYLESVFSLEGKIILMTGAAGGLGAAMAEALAKAGGTVLIGDLDRSPAKELAQKMRELSDEMITSYVNGLQDMGVPSREGKGVHPCSREAYEYPYNIHLSRS